MANAKKRGGLGQGLAALIPQIPDIQGSGGPSGANAVPLERIQVNPYQPRRRFDEDRIGELAASITELGVLQPVILRPHGEEFQLIAGERRVRAASLAGLTEIPAIVREMSDSEMMEAALVENIQRQDLDPVEEARAYKRLSEEFRQTQEQIAERVSKSRSYIANSIRLLNLPAAVLDYLTAGDLTIGHVRPLLTLKEADALQLADRMIREGATAREAELWAKQTTTPSASEDERPSSAVRNEAKEKTTAPLPSELKEIQRILREAVNTKVEITQGARGGRIIIDYYTADDVERILELLTGSREIK